MKRFLFWLLLISGRPGAAWARAPEVQFLDAAPGSRVVRSHDAFTANLSPFDRQARLDTSAVVGPERYLEFIGEQTLPWSSLEKTHLLREWQALARKLEPFHLPPPPRINLVKSTGQEEGQAAYTRGQSIILPRGLLQHKNLQGLLAHELFHILSRQNLEWRWKLYLGLGFRPLEAAHLPPEVARRRITNPDAPLLDCYWPSPDGRRLLPLTLASEDHYKPHPEGMFHYLEFCFYDLDAKEIVSADDVPAYRRRYGTNTAYIIHPEEILADNFSYLVMGKAVEDQVPLQLLRLALQPGYSQNSRDFSDPRSYMMLWQIEGGVPCFKTSAIPTDCEKAAR